MSILALLVATQVRGKGPLMRKTKGVLTAAERQRRQGQKNAGC